MNYAELANIIGQRCWMMSFLFGKNTVSIMNMGAISLAWIEKDKSLTPINLSGCKPGKYGLSRCFTIEWKSARDGWISLSHGAEFLRAHGMDDQGNWYFSLNRSGQPLVQPYNIFSDCFAAMAFGQFALATGSSEAADLALRTYHNILQRKDHTKGQYEKTVPGTRPMKSFALPMILCNLSLELEELLPSLEIEQNHRCCRP